MSIPYHLASNGLAEKAIQTFKATMRKFTKGSIEDKATILLLGRQLHSHLNLLHPDLSAKVRAKQNL